MTARVGRVDHPVAAVNDLEPARERYKQLGFVVPPAGRHREWGTANVCILFSDDYLEIRGIGDSDKFLAGLDKFLVHGEGLCGVAFNSKNADESYSEARATGVTIEPPKALNRKLVLEDKTLDLHFKTVMLGHDLYPGLTHANLCEHLTWNDLRQPGWLDHPNGVVSFGRLTGVVKDFDAAEKAYTLLLGAQNVKRQADRLWLNFEEGANVELITAAEAERRGDAQQARGDAYLAAATLLVKDVAETRRLFEGNGVRFREVEGVLAVNAADACGAHLYFKQA
ncbi:VOC family protein [Variovorax sp. KK3]|uniref:VOC family protein n=1 Tax=Variovorax sp. KK3 TaxID=1855728 RepID=UPI00097CAD3E|nr:VOC family protein [Variovorax sp. KK3]